MNHTLTDPLAFITDALADLPKDPAKLTDDEFARIAAIQQGLARHNVAVLQAAGDLALELHRSEIDLDDALERRDEIVAARDLGHDADAALTTYVSAALEARGHRLEDLLEAATHNGLQEDR